MSDLTEDDIRAGVAAGILDERQAASLVALTHERQGRRAILAGQDEPFEFFRGFAEIFVTVGLMMLFSGILGFNLFLGGGLATALLGMGLCWIVAEYFTVRRRMSLPSIALSLGFGGFVLFALHDLIGGGADSGFPGVAEGLCGMVAMAIYFMRFRLPFAMFVLGLFGLLTVLSLTDTFGASATDMFLYDGFWNGMFDLREDSGFAVGSLVFGILAFLGGMYFDTRDPDRVSRYSATGFWLHILAAPALVNTLALSLYNIGGGTGYSLTALALLAISVLALIIDRRSFLAAGIGYLAALLIVAFRHLEGERDIVTAFVVLGAFITALGAWWNDARAVLMRVLPDFPYKDRLPPYYSKAGE